jgi:O-antigen/teichoic acid export membrane protein
MSLLRKLAGETAVYGATTVAARLLNYLLVPIHTRVFAPGEYGIVTDLYAYVGFFVVLFSYRMETAYFRFAGREPLEQRRAFVTATGSILLSSLLFSGLLALNAEPLAIALRYSHQENAVAWMALVLGLDALTAVPFAQLRLRGNAWRFGTARLLNIGTNISASLFFLLVCPALHAAGHPWILAVYDPDLGVGYVFLANFLASIATLVFLLPEFGSWPQLKVFWQDFDSALWQRMMRYSLPLVVVGLAGIVNEVLDRILLKYLLPGDLETRFTGVGVYGACYKLAMLMTILTQAFQYASEPFFFRHAEREDARQLYARVAQAFAAVGALAFAGVMLFLDVFQYFLGGGGYREGLGVVPILLMANLLLGLYYNVSVWYKLTDRTLMGAWIALGGALVTIGLNIWLIPRIGYMGSAWATLACYASMLVATWQIGQRYYPVPYPVARILLYVAGSVAVYLLAQMLGEWMGYGFWPKMLLHTLLLGAFAAYLADSEGFSLPAFAKKIF